MPSTALTQWTNHRLPRLNDYDSECTAKFLLAPPPAVAEEMLRGYVMLLSASLQGFCRDLYTECLMIVSVNAATVPMMGFTETIIRRWEQSGLNSTESTRSGSRSAPISTDSGLTLEQRWHGRLRLQVE